MSVPASRRPSRRARIGGLIAAVIAVVPAAWWLRHRSERASRADAAEPGVAGDRARAHGRSGALVPVVDDAGVAVPDAAAPRSVAVASASWGRGADQLGMITPDQADPEAPTSFALDADGRLVVLDQVNHRFVRYGRDGRPVAITPLDLAHPDDFALSRDGRAAVLSRRGSRDVTVLAPDGRVRARLPIAGPNLENPDEATGVVIAGEEVYVEREQGELVHVGNLAGRTDTERATLPGRPSRDGLSYVGAGLIEGPEGRFWVNAVDRASMRERFTRELRAGFALQRVLLVDTDRAGFIYVAVEGVLPEGVAGGQSPTDGGAAEEGHDLRMGTRLFCLEPTQGHLLGLVWLQPNVGPELTVRDLVVPDEGGGVLYALRTPQGVTYQRVACP